MASVYINAPAFPSKDTRYVWGKKNTPVNILAYKANKPWSVNISFLLRLVLGAGLNGLKTV